MRALLLLVALPLSAANHYVTPAGAGAANGNDWSNACPWFTGGSCATLIRGDTYYIAGGTYNNSNKQYTIANSSTTLITIKKATAGDHGTETGWNVSFGTDQAVFNQSSSTAVHVFDFQTGYWVLDGATGGGPTAWQTGFGFKINATRTSNPVQCVQGDAPTGIILRHIDCEGDGGDGDGSGDHNNDGFNLGVGDNVLIEYVYVHDVGRCNLFMRPRNTIVQYSYFARNESTAAEHSEMVSYWEDLNPPSPEERSQEVTFRYNIWEEGEGTGGIMIDGHHFYVYGNVFWKTGPDGYGNGIVADWSSNTYGSTNVIVHHNTFVDIDGPGVQFPKGTSTGNTAFNNIFQDVTGGASFSAVATHNYNWFRNAGGTYSEANAQTGASDPFVNSTTGDFHLTAGTNAGSDLASPYDDEDTDGVVRGGDGTKDRGAFEFDAGGTPPTITTTCPLPQGRITAAYSQQMAATGDATITWDLSAGAWPSGISMNSSGAVTGTPTVTGTFSMTLRATNSSGNDTESCSLVISPNLKAPGGHRVGGGMRL